MDTATAAGALVNLDLLSALPDDVRKQAAELFLDVSDVYRFEDSEHIITEGFLSFDTGYALIEGGATIERPDLEVIEVKAPALFGEMSQFRQADLRSATVRAKGDSVAAQFYWSDLYKAAEKTLSVEAHAQFRSAIESQIWERFDFPEIANIALFSGMDDDVRKRACMPFPVIAERVGLTEVDTLFSEGANCKRTGYLLVRGRLRLFRRDKSEKIIEPPNILGIFPNSSDKSHEWTATAMSSGGAEVLKFSWEQYSEQLVRRLNKDEQKAYIASLKANAQKHFWH